LRIGLPDSFVETGEYEYMLKLYGIDAEGISKKILKFLEAVQFL
jgi:transketolase C-terminal domain/subunit